MLPTPDRMKNMIHTRRARLVISRLHSDLQYVNYPTPQWQNIGGGDFFPPEAREKKNYFFVLTYDNKK